MNERVSLALKQAPRKWVYTLILTFIVMAIVIFSFSGSTINWFRFESFGPNFRLLVTQLVNINWDYFFGVGGFEQGVVYKTLETLAMAFLGTLLGAIFALPMGFFAAVNVVGKKWAKVSESILVAIRVFPEIILAIILVKGLVKRN